MGDGMGGIATANRLSQQMEFIIEIDKLKRVLRQTLITDSSRQENSAEHSWHIAIMAMLLAEYSPAPIDLLRVIKMLLIHDLVEIDAGDTFCYDIRGNQDKALREQQAADRLFGLLPADQQTEFRSLWEEFETQTTDDAHFAAVLDRIQPFLHNCQTQGGTWRLHHISHSQVLKRMQPVKEHTPDLWKHIEQQIQTCLAAGYLRPDL